MFKRVLLILIPFHTLVAQEAGTVLLQKEVRPQAAVSDLDSERNGESGKPTFEAKSAESPEDAGPLSLDRIAELTKSFQKKLDESSEFVTKNPTSQRGYSQRGDALFFLGRFTDAVKDYDKMIELDQAEQASHWRRGIALFYAGRYKDAAAQFESYHSFDQIDRENGIWRYLSQHQADGRDKARAGLLKYQKDDREPFPAVYKLFAGTMTPDQIMNQIAEADISKSEREKRLFYAHLYIGLNHAIEGEKELARKHLASATQNTWGPNAGYGPNYMWHVGRLHEALLRKKTE